MNDEPWMQTYTGRRFTSLSPCVEDVDVIDVAHALSHTCRYRGMAAKFYSVAEHSVYVSRIVPSLEALLHDAAEAYSPFGDVPRPYKHLFPIVGEVEAKIEAIIAYHFGLEWPWPVGVKVADAMLLADEKAVLMRPGHDWQLPYPGAGTAIACWSPMRAEYEFLKRFRELEG